MNDFKKYTTPTETRYVLESMTAGATGASNIATGETTVGSVIKREAKQTVTVPITQKPRQGPLRPQTGGGKHKDKKKEQKQGKEKHRKPFMENHPDHEVEMAQADTYQLAKQAMALHKMLMRASEMQGLEGWQQAKITKAADYINAVYKNLAHDVAMDGDIDESQDREVKQQLIKQIMRADPSMELNYLELATIDELEEILAKLNEGFNTDVDMELHKLTKAPDMFDAIYDALGRDDEVGAKLQDMVNDISLDTRLHPDDDIEQIISIIADRLEANYGDPDVDMQSMYEAKKKPNATTRHLRDYPVSDKDVAKPVKKPEKKKPEQGVAEEKQKGVDGKACWKGYKRMGTKKKGGRTVDNCVKVGEDTYTESLWNKLSSVVSEKAPPGDKYERMVKHIKKGYSKDGELTDIEKRKAYGAAWKAKNKAKK